METFLVTTHAVSLVGLEPYVIRVETHVGPGLVVFTVVGLPDASVRESKDRVRAALQSCGVDWFDRRVTVNLSPADIPKAGPVFDLAIAMGLLAARGIVAGDDLAGIVFIAELGLDGQLRAVRGVVPAVLGAVRAGFNKVVVAEANYAEASLVPGAQVRACKHLTDSVQCVQDWEASAPLTIASNPGAGERQGAANATGSQCEPEEDRARQGDGDGTALVINDRPDRDGATPAVGGRNHSPDLGEVRGQHWAVESLLVAAAGGHHLLMIGEAGAGKTMLARCLPSVLPPLTDEAAIETTAVHSLAGTLDAQGGLIRTPPLQMPHHTATLPAIIGGGSASLSPGAVSLAHNGVLFLDEATEFSARVLDGLRQPLESGWANVYRARHRAQLPARFQLILATNPCPCGNALSRGKSCKCSALQLRRYLGRLSGPLLDRVDLHVTMHSPTRADLSRPPEYTSAQGAQRVREARERAAHRWREYPWKLNAHVPSRQLRACGALAPAAANTLDESVAKGEISLRGADRVLRLSLTLADLEGREHATLADVGKALQYRNGAQYGNL